MVERNIQKPCRVVEMIPELRLKGEFFSNRILGNKKSKGQDSKKVCSATGNFQINLDYTSSGSRIE